MNGALIALGMVLTIPVNTAWAIYAASHDYGVPAFLVVAALLAAMGGGCIFAGLGWLKRPPGTG